MPDGTRGPLVELARRMRDDGQEVIDLSLGDPAAHGFTAPTTVMEEVERHLRDACAYTPETGTSEARAAVAHHYRERRGLAGSSPSDVCLGNGVSELASLATQALLDPGDQVLVPSPSYPLWRDCVALTGAVAVPYPCREDRGWRPDPAGTAARVGPRTRALVVVNPGNPTGALWPADVLERVVAVARAGGLALLADEIYDEIRYDSLPFTSTAALAPDLLCLTFSGLSKFCRMPGYRAGWMLASGPHAVKDAYLSAVRRLAALRLCPNAPAQSAVPKALSAPVLAGTRRATEPGGALTARRDTAHEALRRIEGASCVRPEAAFYAYPRLPLARRRATPDFARALLRHAHVLVTPGSVFSGRDDGHVRLTTLAGPAELAEGIDRIGAFLAEERAPDRAPPAAPHREDPLPAPLRKAARLSQ
ncbi:aminotransferase class I/II-fold pyridoxal phosphate-dependent enzyme [Streptomyces albus subsp. chlorinus]|uniref:aminotransferase class I/II-fold pyridoxal phosphate-dependent enzyme n=1 Tax=Streptomyces albus TaxID=1888 RepID=UPI00157064BE|nr:aminotransferase class I/II-fold pyridoxal phosphate-dependent enzyme [Streptomyces albus]